MPRGFPASTLVTQVCEEVHTLEVQKATQPRWGNHIARVQLPDDAYAESTSTIGRVIYNNARLYYPGSVRAQGLSG